MMKQGRITVELVNDTSMILSISLWTYISLNFENIFNSGQDTQTRSISQEIYLSRGGMGINHGPDFLQCCSWQNVDMVKVLKIERIHFWKTIY